MNGWIMLALLAALTGGLLWAIGFPRKMWMVAATALTLGATGYAWQGSPGVPGYNAATAKKNGELDPLMIEMRDAMYGRFNASWYAFKPAEALLRIGDARRAVIVMEGAVKQGPRDPAAWTGLGIALSEHDRGVSPAARFAFDRSISLTPQHGGGAYFLAMAYFRSGDLAECRKWLALALERTPADASYRPVIDAQLRQLDQIIARQTEQASQPPSP
jgi:cytochrome c-type biogenesis protein CcmH